MGWCHFAAQQVRLRASETIGFTRSTYQAQRNQNAELLGPKWLEPKWLRILKDSHFHYSDVTAQAPVPERQAHMARVHAHEGLFVTTAPHLHRLM